MAGFCKVMIVGNPGKDPEMRYQRASEPIDERWIGVNPPGHSSAGKRGRTC